MTIVYTIKMEFAVLDDSFSKETAKSLHKGIHKFEALDALAAKKIIDNLSPMIIDYIARNPGQGRNDDSKEVLNKLNDKLYNLQFVCYESNSEHFVLINALDRRIERPKWREAYKPVLDGGSSYWFGVVNINQLKMTMFNINGRG